MANRALLRLLESSSKIQQANVPVTSLTVRTYSSETPDIETHTGQKFEEGDYRLARFVDRPKQVNPNWAIKLISEMPVVLVKDRVTSCDGGGGPLGHPKVYINVDKPGENACGYCGLMFDKKDQVK